MPTDDDTRLSSPYIVAAPLLCAYGHETVRVRLLRRFRRWENKDKTKTKRRMIYRRLLFSVDRDLRRASADNRKTKNIRARAYRAARRSSRDALPLPPPSLWALWRTFVIIIIVTVVLLLFLLIIIFFFYLHVSKRFRWRHFACLYTAQAHGNVSRSIVFNILIKILVFNNSTSKRVDTCTRARLFSYSAETFVSYTAMILVGRGNKDRRGEGGKKKQIVNYWTVREIGLVMRRPWANRKTTGTVTVDGKIRLWTANNNKINYYRRSQYTRRQRRYRRPRGFLMAVVKRQAVYSVVNL